MFRVLFAKACKSTGVRNSSRILAALQSGSAKSLDPLSRRLSPLDVGDISTVNSTISHRETGQNLIESFSSLNESEAEIDSNTTPHH